MEATYLGKKGYTICKECLSLKDQKFIRQSLTVSPYIPMSPAQPPSYPVFLESNNKFYIPRYFGIEHFGEPDAYHITTGNHINITFAGELRDYQKDIIDSYMSSIDKIKGGGGLLDIPCGWGKTAMSLYIISILKVKTIVIVHKGFLLKQWEERIAEFIPTAKVGKIQGEIVDIEGKDIVIGMLQSLSMKTYSSDTFSSFGLTVVDECHHISSEVFSKSLNIIVTKYTLGLSATMKRKDGLSHVFKMFLGPIVYSAQRNKEDHVLVKTLQYNSNDAEFENVVLDYRGNPQYSTMISKLCCYNHRTEFILKVIQKELEEEPDQQIMVLGQNKNILDYIFKAISHRSIASVGYYIGGMKEEQLKISETKKIIVATYAMASEGLDIKTLTTLILATPRTDVTQAIGRILRVKRDRPLVVDILDTHDVFQRQYKKRLAFYRKNKYSVLHSDNQKYFINEWENYSVKSKQIKEKPSRCLISISV